MKFALSLLFCILLKLCQAQNYLPYSKDAPLELGHGFNIADPTEPKLPFLENPGIKDDGQGANIVIDYKLIENKEVLNELFSRDFSFNARFLYKRFSTTFDIKEEYLNSAHYKTIVFIGKSEFGNQSVSNFQMTTDAKQLIAEKNYDAFIERYGSHFVQKVSKGVSLYVFLTVKIDASYYSSSDGLQVDASGGLIGGEIGVRDLLRKQRGRKNIEVKVVSNGPDNFGELSKNILTAIDSENEDPLESIKRGIGASLEKYNKTNSYITGYYYAPMSLFGVPKEKLQWNDLKEKKLVHIKSEYEDVEEFMKEMAELKSNCYYVNTKQTTKDSLNSALTEVLAYKDSLEKTHARCVNLNSPDKMCDIYLNEEELQARFINSLKQILTVVDSKLRDTEVSQGHIRTWTFPVKCYEGEALAITFSCVFANHKLWNLSNIYLDVDFLVNGVVIYNHKGSTTGGQAIKFENKPFWDGSPTDKEIKFSVRMNKCNIITLGQPSDTKTVPLQQGELSVLADFE